MLPIKIKYFLFISILLAGCSEVKLGGYTINEAFDSPHDAALIRAAIDNDFEEMKRLIELGANPNSLGRQRSSVLAWVYAANSADGLKSMLSLGADPNLDIFYGDTLVCTAAGGNDLRMLKILLEAGGDPNCINRQERSALTVAVFQRKDENFRLLVEFGANMEYDLGKRTVANIAADLGRMHLVVYMLEKGYSYQLDSLYDSIRTRPIRSDEGKSMKNKAMILIREKMELSTKYS